MLLRVVAMGGRIRDRIVPVDYYIATPVNWDFSPHGIHVDIKPPALFATQKHWISGQVRLRVIKLHYDSLSVCISGNLPRAAIASRQDVGAYTFVLTT